MSEKSDMSDRGAIESAGDRRVRGEVAIVGMAALFPGAPDLTTYWQNILGKVDAVSDPPEGSWDPAIHFDADSNANDRVYCKRGGYLGPIAYFDPLEHGIMPLAVDGGEPDQWLALKVAKAALEDAGYLENLAVRHRTSVVIGKGTYINRGNLTLVQHGLIVDQTLSILRSLHPEYGKSELDAIREELKRHLPPFTTETVPGLIPNIIAGRIANRLDLMGPSYTVDAACASSLIALQIAQRDLLTGECDMALVGGSQITTPVPILGLFCQLNALSRRQQIRPFDTEADGTILGEGIGMVALKRRADAERDGDRIYALLKGVGTASDGRAVSVMAPRIEGEETALRRAYDVAGVEPSSIGLIEAHGTGTPVGDATEIQALTRVFGARAGGLPHCAIGSVKSMIGHTMPAAGIAGVIKAALALYHRVLPPMINVTEPNPKLKLDETPFYVSGSVRPWSHGDETPRRAGVNAFGFGGINAHAVLEEYPHTAEAELPTHQLTWDSEAVILRAGSKEALVAAVDALLDQLDASTGVALKDVAYTLNTAAVSGSCRLGIVATDVDDLVAKLKRARQRLDSPNCQRIKDATGIYYFSQPLAAAGKIAVLFPGEGAQYPNMLADLAVHFPQVRQAVDEIDRVFWQHPRGYRPSDLLFPPPLLPASEREALESRLWQIDGAVEAVLTGNQALWSLVRDLKLTPDAVVGHSTGEYSAMRAAGILDLSDRAVFARFAGELNQGYETAALDGSGVPQAAMLAVGAEREQVEAVVGRVPGALYVAMDNCPHQAVIVGDRAAVEEACALVKQEGWLYEFLLFDRAYHTQLFAPYAAHLRDVFARLPITTPTLPIYSCTTAAPYPKDPEEIRHLMVDHWVQPVEFRRTVEALYDEGVRLFVEVGPRGNLSAFVEDILRGRQFGAIPLNVARRSGITQLNHAVAQLAAQGVDLDLAPLYRRRRPERLTFETVAPRRSERRLATGFPVLALSDSVAERLRQSAPPAAVTPAAPTASAAILSAPPQAPTVPAVPAAPLVPVAPDPAPFFGALPAPADSSSAAHAFLSTMDQFLGLQEQVMRSFLDSAPAPARAPATRFPLLGDLVEYVPGESLVCRRTFDPDEDLYLRDHTLGRRVSEADPALTALAVMPLTMSLEILAEAAAYLAPHAVVTGMREIRASRWIAFDGRPQTLQIAARVLDSDGAVSVQVRNLTEDAESAEPQKSPVLEATVLLADRYASPPAPIEPSFSGERPTRWIPGRLYEDAMFHGPCWQGVASIERTAIAGSAGSAGGDGGASGAGATLAALPVLPFETFFRSVPQPHFEIDPVVLDAAGQVIGFWTMEHLPSARLIFPFRVAALEVYGPLRPSGETIACAASIALVGEQQVRSDIDMLDGTGRLWMRLTGWEDKRFELPARFYPLLLSPDAEVSVDWAAPLSGLSDDADLRCRRASATFPSDRPFWKRVWAQCILGAGERERFRALRTPEPRQLEWLAGRAAAKDAVRQLLRERLQLDPLPADVEIWADERGCPRVRLLPSDAWDPWRRATGTRLAVSIAHSDGEAVAIAAMTRDALADGVEDGVSETLDTPPLIGIDVERLRALPAGFAGMSFSPEELACLQRAAHGAPGASLDEWMLRAWCAKEAVGKALGRGLPEGPQSVRIEDASPTGGMSARLAGQLAQAFPALSGRPIAGPTHRQEDLVVATTLCESESHTHDRDVYAAARRGA